MASRNYKKLIILVLCLTIYVWLSVIDSDAFAGDTLEPDSLQDALLFKAIEYAFNDSFPAARVCLDGILTDDHDFWPAYVFKIGVLYTEMTDDERYDRVDYFKALIDTAEDGLDEFLEKNPDDKWAYFFKGTAMGYGAIYEGHHGSWLKAVLQGMDAGKQFSKAIEIDSTFYEAYLGLGNLNYWRSAKMGILRILPFISDKREEGIRQVQLAMDSARYTALPGAAGMAWIYYHKKDYNRAVRLVDAIKAKGYTGRQLLWPKGLAHFKRGYARGTIETFETIREGLERKGNQNYYNIGLCDYYMGLAYFWMGDYDIALAYLNTLLERKVDEEVGKRLKKNYKAAEKYIKKIEKAAAERKKYLQDAN